MTELLLVLVCAHAGKAELSCRRVKFSHVPAAGILSYYIDFDEQIPLESLLSTPDRQVQVHHISTGSGESPLGLRGAGLDWLHTSMSWSLSNLVE